MALFESYERRIDQINAALNKYGIKDIRLFFENDIRFLEQFTAAGI